MLHNVMTRPLSGALVTWQKVFHMFSRMLPYLEEEEEEEEEEVYLTLCSTSPYSYDKCSNLQAAGFSGLSGFFLVVTPESVGHHIKCHEWLPS